MAKQVTLKTDDTASSKKTSTLYAFGRENYLLMIVGLVVMLIGYLLMIGGGSKDPNVFNYKMFDFQRMTLSPIIIFIGILIELVAIFKKPKA